MLVVNAESPELGMAAQMSGLLATRSRKLRVAFASVCCALSRAVRRESVEILASYLQEEESCSVRYGCYSVSVTVSGLSVSGKAVS
jgi:hypothetical protein